MERLVKISFDEKHYSVVSLQKAAYKGINIYSFELLIEDGQYICKLIPDKAISDEVLQHAVQEFRKNALDYQLREKINSETEDVRNLILSIAFSRTGLQENN